LGIGLPKTPFLGGDCDYDLVVFDTVSGQQLLCSSGNYSDHTDLTVVPPLPSASPLGENMAKVLEPSPPSGAAAQPTASAAVPNRQLPR
jgi:hypothetical protein